MRTNEFLQKFLTLNVWFVPQSIRDLEWNAKKLIMSNIANRLKDEGQTSSSTDDLNVTNSIEKIAELAMDLLEDKFFFDKLHIEVDKKTLSVFRANN